MISLTRHRSIPVIVLLSAALVMPVLACRRDAGLTQLTAATASAAPGRTPIPDADIVRAITHRLKEDSAVRQYPVEVDVKDGICTLTGTVGNLLAKDRARKIADTLRGVRSVVDRIDVRPSGMTDKELEMDVSRQLTNNPATRPHPVGIATADGTVTLAGAVASWPEKELFTEAVKSMKGVRRVDNQLTVTYPFVRRDSEIAEDVKAHIANDIWLDGNAISATVVGHVVTLKGVVRSVAERSRARSDAWLPGVRDVDDTAVVVDWALYDDQRAVIAYAYRSDDDIARAVRDAFKLDPRVAPLEPHVSVRGGIVELTGMLSNLGAKRAAALDARNTSGVYDVHDLATVEPTVKATDAEIDRRVKRALSEDARLAGDAAIHATTQKGKVVLTGAVESGLDRFDAIADVASVPSVIEIVDDTSVKRSPEELKAHIEDLLLWDAVVRRDSVEVAVDSDGVATLAGKLDSWSELRAAVDDATRGGAKRVISLLQVTKHDKK